MTKVISVIGNVASGKTTLARGLADKLPGFFLDCDPFVENPFLETYAKNRSRWALATELHFTLSRYKQLSQEFAKDRRQPIIIDSGLAMGIGVYVKQHLHAKTMTHDEYDLFRELTSILIPKEHFYPDIALFTKCSVSTCLHRVKDRGRDFEKYYDTEYLTKLEQSLVELQANFHKHGVPVITLDSEDVDYRKSQAVIEAIEKAKL